MAFDSALAEKTLEHIAVTSELIARLSTTQNEKSAEAKAAADLSGKVVEHMLQIGVIATHEKSAAETALTSHAKTLEILDNALNKIAEYKAAVVKSAAANLGAPDSGASTGNTRPHGNYLGERTSAKKASDKALFDGLGIPQG